MPGNPQVVEREIFIDAAPKEVFRYLVERDLMARWIGHSHELEPHPGGRFRVEVSSGNIARGVFREVVPPRRVAFTWGWESQDGALAALPPGASLVEIDLEAKEGGTLLRLRHSRLPADLAPQHGERWLVYLAELQTRAAAEASH
jgi:uncharacterized protein YndB with AHSA1/START domain